ncbi:hypothetical protein O0I10_008094 [Lichtheimia ornata]|uniref:Uncharacterized protein n=1 Tax=Lichtheimia ornata TaxID=688661 RepID=A0AAD7XVT2_9FUNG|nr:uncharacterized protein O0I10_008094 [Lichtheimia ornata]KAJ8656300.1 hypothetical protein O0I10_008094 [Lichtheimia ornata]
MVKDTSARYQWHTHTNSGTREPIRLTTNSNMATMEHDMTTVGLAPEEIRKHMRDPPLCFCNKKAHRSETALGTMYDCHNLQDEKAQKICGFHIHGKAWSTFRERGRLDADDPELSVCPYFNFTFCVRFRVINDYSKQTLAVPRCFCGLRVKMAEQNDRIVFKCPNYDIDGAKPKCAWNLWAEQVAFGKPQPLLHDFDSFRNDD